MEEKERQKRAEELLVGEEISNLSSQEGAEKRPVSEETVHIAESVAALEEEEPEHLEDRVKMLSPGAVVAKRFFRSKLSVIGLITLIVLFVFSFAGPLLQFVTPAIWGQDEVDRSPGKIVEINSPYEYDDIDGNDQVAYEYIASPNAFNFDGPISPTHLLGTDKNGYDVLSRLMYGGRISLTL